MVTTETIKLLNALLSTKPFGVKQDTHGINKCYGDKRKSHESRFFTYEHISVLRYTFRCWTSVLVIAIEMTIQMHIKLSMVIMYQWV